MTDDRLYELAAAARENAYAPYSGFRVGAALATCDGKIYTGCNIENSSYGDTCCAERVALFKAVSEGERLFGAIAVVGGRGEKPDAQCMPCGICLQALAEFCPPDFRIITAALSGGYAAFTLKELLPHAFSPGK